MLSVCVCQVYDLNVLRRSHFTRAHVRTGNERSLRTATADSLALTSNQAAPSAASHLPRAAPGARAARTCSAATTAQRKRRSENGAAKTVQRQHGAATTAQQQRRSNNGAATTAQQQRRCINGAATTAQQQRRSDNAAQQQRGASKTTQQQQRNNGTHKIKKNRVFTTVNGPAGKPYI